MNPLQKWALLPVSLLALATSSSVALTDAEILRAREANTSQETNLITPSQEKSPIASNDQEARDNIRRTYMPGGAAYEFAHAQLLKNNPYLDEGGIWVDDNESGNASGSVSDDEAFLNDLESGDFHITPPSEEGAGATGAHYHPLNAVDPWQPPDKLQIIKDELRSDHQRQSPVAIAPSSVETPPVTDSSLDNPFGGL